MKVCTASQALSTRGILSAMNSMTNIVAAMPITSGCDRMSSDAGRSTQPIRWKKPAAATVA